LAYEAPRHRGQGRAAARGRVLAAKAPLVKMRLEGGVGVGGFGQVEGFFQVNAGLGEGAGVEGWFGADERAGGVEAVAGGVG
jgi:hypothetical protein